ncbi:MAG: NAD(P)-binding protein [Streptosporangiales bacterium]|nr:NAD(P)-binding protein [Streptosporangiales bacterium]
MSPHAIVVGGGLAGIAAAIALSEAGAGVTLLEGRPRLGGATHSFTRGDLVVDNGQHVFLRCCTAYRGLLDRLGVADRVALQDRFDVTVLRSDGRRARLRRTNLPGPLHLGPALARYSLLTPAERAGAARAALALRGLNLADPALDLRTFGEWLGARGQDGAARRGLWDLFVVASLNAGSDEASLGLAAMVVQTGLLGARDAADIGVPAVPLQELHGESAARLLARSGAEVRTRAKVTAVEPHPGGPGAGFAVIVDGTRLDADAVVVAVPHDAAASLVPEAAVPDRWRFARLGATPIINVHVIYDRQVTSLPFAAAVDSPVQWVFDRTRISGTRHGQYLAVSVSAADPHIDRPTTELRGEFLPALDQLFPAARRARVVDFFVTRERRATFRQAPGCSSLRPPARTRLPGLFIAGAWTDTGWPDTMEGAVRSGLVAARLAREHLFPAEGSSAEGSSARVPAAGIPVAEGLA